MSLRAGHNAIHSSVKINISHAESHQFTAAQGGERGEDHQRLKPTWHQRS
jgi:hypothetical protein